MAPYGGKAPVSLPVTEQLSASNLALPMSPVLSAEDASRVVAAIAAFADRA